MKKRINKILTDAKKAMEKPDSYPFLPEIIESLEKILLHEHYKALKFLTFLFIGMTYLGKVVRVCRNEVGFYQVVNLL